MPVVSLSLPEQMVKDIDEIQETVGFAGRSELVRAAIRMMLGDVREKEEIEGVAAAVIVVGHGVEDEEPVTRLKHRFEDIVRTHVHSKVSHEDCVEVFILSGEGRRITAMKREFQRERRIRSVKLLRE